ncbi:hypothetical protein G6F43_013335 [Rhizopus delemar]|nr:hypothetical protein G6F43_013335 [Rhizopus delemar]
MILASLTLSPSEGVRDPSGADNWPEVRPSRRDKDTTELETDIGENKALCLGFATHCNLSDHHFQKLFINLRALTVRSFDKPDYDLTPLLTKLHYWGSNDNITVEQLTRELCFLLAITGFLRHSDLHRINLGKTSVTANDSQLKLLIDCPKEKRQGSPIERVVIINHHPDPILCPVKAFQSYLTRVANAPCFGPHPTRPSRTINFLIRKLNDFSVSVSVLLRIHKIIVTLF